MSQPCWVARWAVISLVVLGSCLTASAAGLDEAARTDLPLMPANPHSLHGKVEMKVESGLIDFGPVLLFGLLMGSGVGLALGEDVFIVPAGFLMQRGIMPFWWTVAAAYFGVVLADTIWVLVVRRFSSRILNIRLFRRMFHPRRILEIKLKFDRYGAWVIVASRFVPFSRTPVFTAAGLTRMSMWKFVLAESLSAMPVVALQLGLGWLLAIGFSESVKEKHIRDAIVVAIAVIAVVTVLWIWRRRRRMKARPPRAPAVWLREAIREGR